MPHTDRGVVLRRALAFAIDALVVVVAIQPVATTYVRSRRWRLPTTTVLAAIVGLPYHVFLEGRYGRTPGKAVARIAVVAEDGGRPTYAAAALRTVLRFVDWLPVGYLLGLVAIALTDRDQRVGDVVAGTLVVRDD